MQSPSMSKYLLISKLLVRRASISRPIGVFDAGNEETRAGVLVLVVGLDSYDRRGAINRWVSLSTTLIPS